LKKYAEFFFRNGKEIIKTKPRANIIDQDSLPMPAWHLLPKAKMYNIQTERGCPFNYQFCANHNGRVARKRSAEKVIEEFKLLIELAHPEYINIGDEIFTVDMPIANQIMELMIENNIHNQVKWDVQTHVKYINRGLMKQFNRAKIYELHMGVEAGDEISLKKLLTSRYNRNKLGSLEMTHFFLPFYFLSFLFLSFFFYFLAFHSFLRLRVSSLWSASGIGFSTFYFSLSTLYQFHN
jgi:radical SAM superfamily enzyme YgiQ (UPF0313 family)